jgi:hypothetical protein
VFVVPVECLEDGLVKIVERLIASHGDPAPDAPGASQSYLENED